MTTSLLFVQPLLFAWSLLVAYAAHGWERAGCMVAACLFVGAWFLMLRLQLSLAKTRGRSEQIDRDIALFRGESQEPEALQ